MAPSTLPFLCLFNILGVISSLLVFSKWGYYFGLVIRVLIRFWTLNFWVKRVKTEGLVGHHTPLIVDRFKVVFFYFILSEFIFFFGIFWVLLDAILAPLRDLGESWVPLGVKSVNPKGLPLLNSFLLLSSAVSLTVAHHQFLGKKNIKPAIILTLFLGFLFIVVQ